MRVVVDTNCLIASIPRFGTGYWLYLAFRDKAFTWIVSTEILNEYFEILSSFYSVKTAENVMTALFSSSNVEFTEPNFIYNLIVDDPDDNKFANLAISANAHYLVSNDKHFDIFKTIDFPPLEVVKLDQFKQILNY
jgi:uncharacterized protein